MQNKWDERYNTDGYFFGKQPNDFFKTEIEKLKPGKALFVGEGEGRNSVYAATLGWTVDAIDNSKVGKTKADLLAKENNVKLNYVVADAFKYTFTKDYYDAIFLIYFHVPKDIRSEFNFNILSALKENGNLVLLVYDEEHLENNANGPSDINYLYTLQELAEDFIDLSFNIFEKETFKRDVNGKTQKATVIKFVGEKYLDTL